MSINNKIQISESKYNSEIEDIFSRIKTRSDVRLILIAGPSCSGKTTTTQKLVSLFAGQNVKCHMISIDDFYKDVEIQKGKQFGEGCDFEAIESIDLAELHKCLKNLTDGKEAVIPKFSFHKAKRDGISSVIKLGESDIAIIEGLHALNPVIYESFVPENKIFKIFLDCKNINSDSKYEKLPRLVRRLVRDSNFRNADAEKTFYLWENVVRGEEKYIYPYANLADDKINTFFSYETALFKNFALEILSHLPSNSRYTEKCSLIREYLDKETEYITSDLVPANSMLREFIG